MCSPSDFFYSSNYLWNIAQKNVQMCWFFVLQNVTAMWDGFICWPCMYSFVREYLNVEAHFAYQSKCVRMLFEALILFLFLLCQCSVVMYLHLIQFLPRNISYWKLLLSVKNKKSQIKFCCQNKINEEVEIEFFRIEIIENSQPNNLF